MLPSSRSGLVCSSSLSWLMRAPAGDRTSELPGSAAEPGKAQPGKFCPFTAGSWQGPSLPEAPALAPRALAGGAAQPESAAVEEAAARKGLGARRTAQLRPPGPGAGGAPLSLRVFSTLSQLPSLRPRPADPAPSETPLPRSMCSARVRLQRLLLRQRCCDSSALRPETPKGPAHTQLVLAQMSEGARHMALHTEPCSKG